MSSDYIALESVTKTFGKSNVAAVNDISFGVKKDELFVLLGPSGSGKTTILKMIAGIFNPDAGNISIDSKLMNGVPSYKRNAPLVFQNYALFPHLTVYQNIEFGLKLRKLPEDEIRRLVNDVLKLVKLEGSETKHPGELSGGQQQRVALARSIVINPAVLLLDEPLSNLDAKLRTELRVELKEIIKRSRMTAIYVTHDLIEALYLADRIAIISNGRLIQIGSPETVFRNPSSQFVAQFVGYASLPDGQVVDGDRDETRVKFDDLELVCKTTGEFKKGDKATLYYRPEDVKLSAAQTKSGPNAFDARVEQRIFLGELTEYRLQVARRLFAVKSPESELKEGQQVIFSMEPSKLVLLSNES